MRRSSFAQAAIGDGANALNRVFNQYLVPVTFSSEQLHLHMSYNDVVAPASPIWYDDSGTVLAAALLAIRGRRGWIGGFGVAPEYRGRGFASELLESLLETARERGLQTLALEVLTDNAPAIATYRSGGFRVVRELHSFEIASDSVPTPVGFTNTPVSELIDEPDPVRPCWQRERATLRNGAVSTGLSDSRGNFALFRFNAAVAQVLKLHANTASDLALLGRAISGGRSLQSVMILNEPADSPLAQLAHAMNSSVPFRQYEMMTDL